MQRPNPVPPDMSEFATRFGTESVCAAHLFLLRYPNGYVCPKCASRKAWLVAEQPGTMLCENLHKVTVKSGTGFHRSRIPLLTWFAAIWLVATSKNGVAAVQLGRTLGLTRNETAWELLRSIRQAMGRPGTAPLASGPGAGTSDAPWVELDEVQLCGATSLGAAMTVVTVVVAVERYRVRTRARDPGQEVTGHCRIQYVSDDSAPALRAFLRANVLQSAKVSTRKAARYDAVRSAGYSHGVILAQDGHEALPAVRHVVDILEHWLRDTHRGAVRAQHLQGYLDEFCFLFHQDETSWKAFDRLLHVVAFPAADLPVVGTESPDKPGRRTS